MLSQTVEYALRAMVFLADRHPQAATTDQISAATLVPKPYLSKVLQGLARGDLVRTQRGVGGGVALTRLPQDVSLLQVVNAVEPLQRIRTCPLGLSTHGVRLCPLHRRLDAALAQMEAAFSRTTLAEILAEPTSSYPLCDLSVAAAAGSD
jgi:Rrf2 family transcriptional regulator, nitric oxide-sensitive transcriptional repressor